MEFYCEFMYIKTVIIVLKVNHGQKIYIFIIYLSDKELIPHDIFFKENPGDGIPVEFFKS